MAKKVYAIRKGNKTGLVYSWYECKEAITGFSGAEYKGFNSVEDAKAYLEASNVNNTHKLIITDDNTVNIFIGSSYKDGKAFIGIVTESSSKTHKFYGVVNCGQYSSLSSIAGELLSVLIGVQIAKDMGYTNLNIYYNYDGVKLWYTGEWRAKGDLQIKYVALLKSLQVQNNLNYNFIDEYDKHMVNSLITRAKNFRYDIDIDLILKGILTVRNIGLYK